MELEMELEMKCLCLSFWYNFRLAANGLYLILFVTFTWPWMLFVLQPQFSILWQSVLIGNIIFFIFFFSNIGSKSFATVVLSQFCTKNFRYRAIKHPMEYSQAQTSGNHKAIFGSILIIWGVAVAVGLPIMFGLNDRYGIFLIFF